MNAYFEVDGNDLKWEYNGKLYSITGNDMGAVSGLPGSVWVEGNYLAYVDEYGHKRLYYLDPTNVFPDGAIPGALFVNPNDSMLRVVTSAKEVRLTGHSDHSDSAAVNKLEHSNSSAHSDLIEIDIPHQDRYYYTDVIPVHDDYSPPHSDYTDHGDTAHSDSHSDSPYRDEDPYTDHSNAPHADEHGNTPYRDDVREDHSDYAVEGTYYQEDWADHMNVPYVESHANTQHYDEDWYNHVDTPYADTHSDQPHVNYGGYSDYTDGIYTNWTDSLPGPEPHGDKVYTDHSNWVDESHGDWNNYQKNVQHLDTPRIQPL